MDIDDRWLDVYFPDDPNYVFGDLGGALCSSATEYEAAEPLLSWSEIDAAIEQQEAEPETTLEYLVRRIYDQGREGSCVGNAGTQGIEVVGSLQEGKDVFPELSAISLYKQIGRSASSGAMVSDAMEAIRDVGVLPLDTPANRAKYGDHVMPATGFSTPFPAGWKSTSAGIRGFEFLTLRSTQALFSASVRRRPIIVGREGHSILYLRALMQRRFKYANSWNLRWGMPGGTLTGGFGVDSQRQVEKSASWAFAIRAIRAAA
jgi:hypothetical protein